MKYYLTIPLEPKPKGRPRATVIAGHASVYTPKETRLFEAKVAAIAAEHIKEPLIGPIRIQMTFYLKRPQRLMRAKDSQEEVYCSSRPDLSNLEKAIEDGLNGIAFVDDAQIAIKHSVKFYHEKSGFPRIAIILENLEG